MKWEQVIINGEEYHYEVSNTGLVRNTKTERFVKQCKVSGGYLQVCLCKNNKKKNFLVHRLVANAFIPNIGGLETVNHKNEIKTDNRVENLEWMSRTDNLNYGTHNKRVGKALSKKVMAISLTETKVLVFQSIAQAERQGFQSGNICKCLNGQRKSHKGYIWRYLE